MRSFLALVCVVLALAVVGLGGCGGDSFTAAPTGSAGSSGGEGAVSGGGNSAGGSGGGACVPVTCEALGASCGRHADGCGGVVECGGCTGEQCLNDGVKWACSCTPKTCAQLGATCGLQDDGCGGPIACGNCDAPTVCAGKACECPFPAPDCAKAGIECGDLVDLCGRKVNCGTCPETAKFCGGGAAPVPGKCGDTECVPKDCKAQGAECGLVNDGCGNVLRCADCPSGTTCGGGAEGSQKANICGCTPKTDVSEECGKFGDGCGGTLEKNCVAPQTCQADNKCACIPKFEEAECKGAGYECGKVYNGCGSVDCGVCSSGDCQAVYDASGTQTGSKCVASCTPKTCDDWYAEFKTDGFEFCGVTTDGCGKTLDCTGTYTCGAPDSCAGGGRANSCGCTLKKAADVCPGKCGAVDNGCGGTIDCSSLCTRGGGTCLKGGTCQPPPCGGACTGLQVCCNGVCSIKCIGLPL